MLLFLASCRWWLHSTYQLRNLWPSCSSRYCYYYYHGIITTIINEKKYKTTSCCCAVLVLLTFFCLLVFVSSLSHTWLFVLKMHVRSFYYCFWSLNKERTKTYENCPEDHVNFVACQSRRTTHRARGINPATARTWILWNTFCYSVTRANNFCLFEIPAKPMGIAIFSRHI